MRRILVRIGDAGADVARCAAEPLFTAADEIVLAPDDARRRLPRADGRDAADLYAFLRPRAARVLLARCEADALEHVCRAWRPGDETVSVSANADAVTGTTLAENPLGRLLSALPPRRLRWIGMGSNTWKSDLDLDVVYRRTSGPADAPGSTLGIPWMAGIPGTVGGWIRMNAGAFGHSISEALEAVRVDGVWRRAEDCGFAYRHSAIDGEISDFRLRPPAEIPTEGTAQDYLRRRHGFPPGTFGSFFKNPPGDSAGRLLEAAGAKALRVGGAYVWNEHANVIVAGPDATASDVLALARLMMARAFASAGIVLEPEVRGIFE